MTLAQTPAPGCKDRFVRLAAEPELRLRRCGGTGLGLAICKLLAAGTYGYVTKSIRVEALMQALNQVKAR